MGSRTFIKNKTQIMNNNQQTNVSPVTLIVQVLNQTMRNYGNGTFLGRDYVTRK